jgi:hypothetical protein
MMAIIAETSVQKYFAYSYSTRIKRNVCPNFPSKDAFFKIHEDVNQSSRWLAVPALMILLA